MLSKKPRLPPLDPEEGRRLILQAIQSSDAPAPLAALGSIPELGRKVPGTQVRKLIARDLASGTVFQWGAGKATAFWNRNPKALARERILDLTARELLTSAEIKKRLASGVPPLSPTIVPRLLKELKGQLRDVPPAPNSRTRRLVNAGHPAVYIEEAVTTLLQSFGLARSPAQIRALLAAEESQPPQDDPVRGAAEKIFSAMNQLAFSPGATVTFYRLRQHPELSDIPKQIFDRAALLLQDERRALLSIHGHATALPEAEREGLVTDGHGNYYVSLYSR